MTHRRRTLGLLLTLALALAAPAARALPTAGAAAGGVVARDAALDPFRDPQLDAPFVHALRQEWLREHVSLPDVRAVAKAALPEWAQGDFLHIAVDLTLDPASSHVTARTTIPFRARGATTAATFMVAPLAVESVAVEAPKDAEDPIEAHTATATYNDDTWQLRVEFQPGLADGEEVLIEVTMSGVFACDGLSDSIPLCGFAPGLSFATGLPFFPTPVNEAELFTADLAITVPDGYVAAVNGELVETTAAEGFTTFRFERPYPGRYVVFSVADYDRTDGLAGDVPLHLYTFPSDTGQAEALLGEAAEVIDFYSSMYAPFPYGQLGIVEMGRDFGGGFGPLQAIFMSSGVFRATPDSRHWSSFVQLQSHEIGHQWWGNFIGIGDNDSVVVSEGMAEFSSAWYYEVRKGSRSNFVTNGYSYMYTVPATGDVAVASGNVYYSGYYYPIVYQKGSVVMDMLRWELGEDTFGALLYELFARHGGGFARVRDIQELASEVAGEDLSWFFRQWYEEPGFPRLDIRVRQEQRAAADWAITLRISQTAGRSFRLTLPVFWRAADGELREEHILVDDDTVEYVIESEGPALTVSPDPSHRVLQITRSSDANDVNLTGDVDAFDLLDLAARYGTAIVADWNGNEYFWPDPRYESRFDVDGDGRIDAADRDAVLGTLTWTSVADDAPR